ncbi:hypothetical protein [Oceanobacillus manasiensis]|uniref:hypothetical protein n=1 Tax=Oceanobacillus manasiensis TaxID=586413 RepID=UPI0005A77DAA|nr:hypothetical protein [Oceanobacillus manasiensis]
MEMHVNQVMTFKKERENYGNARHKVMTFKRQRKSYENARHPFLVNAMQKRVFVVGVPLISIHH